MGIGQYIYVFSASCHISILKILSINCRVGLGVGEVRVGDYSGANWVLSRDQGLIKAHQ